MKRHKTLLLETGNNPYKWRWVTKTDKLITARAITHDNRKMDIKYSKISNVLPRYEVAFTIDGRDDITDKGDAYRILSTFIDNLKEFIELFNPKSIDIYAKDDDLSDYDENDAVPKESRGKIYKRLLDRLMNKIDGYTYKKLRYHYSEILFRIKLK